MVKKLVCSMALFVATLLLCNGNLNIYASIIESGNLGPYVEWNIEGNKINVIDNHLEYAIEIVDDNCTVRCNNGNASINKIDPLFDYNISEEERQILNGTIDKLGLLEKDEKFNLIFSDNVAVINTVILNRERIRTVTVGTSCSKIDYYAMGGLENLTSATIYSRDVELQDSYLGFVLDDSGQFVTNKALVIFGYENSTAETYAAENGFTFIALDESISTTTAQGQATTTGSETTDGSVTTTTTASESSISTTDATAESTIASSSTPSNTTIWYASKEEYVDWAIKDYTKKTGVTPANGETLENEDGTLSVTLFDENGEVLDTYTIDPTTGEGMDANGETVNLPQTGMTSPVTAAVTAGAVFLLLAGTTFLVVAKKRRKEETE